MQYVFSIILLIIIFLVMDYFWKGDEFSGCMSLQKEESAELSSAF